MNKKLVILIVLVECILAVLIVSFFGKVIEETRRDVLCQDIYFVDENGIKIEDGVFKKEKCRLFLYLYNRKRQTEQKKDLKI